MQISKTFDYAIRALIFLGEKGEEGCLDLRDISKSQKVPFSYLAKIMRSLVRAGIVQSTLGRDGGYILRKKPNSISLYEIYRAMEGELHLVECQNGDTSCTYLGSCTQELLWSRLKTSITDILKTTYLSNLLRKEKGYGQNAAAIRI